MKDRLKDIAHYLAGAAVVIAGLDLVVYSVLEGSSLPSMVFAAALGLFMAAFGLLLISDGLDDDDDERPDELELDDGEEVTVSA